MTNVTTTTGNTILESGFFPPCRAATTGTNIALVGLQVIDGVTLLDADRVLVKDQQDRTQNGIYAASTGNWARTTDAQSNRQFFDGMAVVVAQGAVNPQSTWMCTTPDDPVIIGTSKITWALLTPPLAPGRTSLTADTTFYVSMAGSDSNNGLSAVTPWLRLQHAHDTIANNYDTRGYIVTIQLADGGPYAGLVSNKGFVGQGGFGEYVIMGNLVTPTNVVINGGLAQAFSFGANSGGHIGVTLEGLYIQSTLQAQGGTGDGVQAWGAGTSVTVTNCYFAVGGVCLHAAHAAELAVSVAIFCVASAAALVVSETAGRFVSDSGQITFQNSPTFSLATVYCAEAQIIMGGATFPGGAFVTGQRYSVLNNGIISTGGAGPNYFPGTIAGVAVAGGTYN